jgi:hypothetical protein
MPDKNDRAWTLDEFGAEWTTEKDGSLAQVALRDRRGEILARYYAQSANGQIYFAGFTRDEEGNEAYVDDYRTESAARKELLGVALLCRIARLEETARVATAKARNGDTGAAIDLLNAALLTAAPTTDATFDDIEPAGNA